MDSNINKGFKISIQHSSDVPKYQQIINSIQNAIAENVLNKGDLLPSVNFLCKEFKLSRDTIFKSYSILKNQHIIDSVPNKGYYVANDTRKVLLVLDTFKAYKEVLYHSFIENIPKNYVCDVQFHHYNIDNFKSILNNSTSKYYKYIVMGFDNDEVPSILSKIQNDKLLLIDWNIHANGGNNFICQDFGEAFSNALKEALNHFEKYKKMIFVYPEYTNHPKETLDYFNKLTEKQLIKSEVLFDSNRFEIEKNVAYISVSDRILGRFLEQCRTKKMEPGVDVGFLSYNETPMKKFIYKGISVVSTDFKALGTQAASFVKSDIAIRKYIPTKLILRESL